MTYAIREGERTLKVSGFIADGLEGRDLIYYCEEDGCYHHDYDLVVVDDLVNTRAWAIIACAIKQLEDETSNDSPETTNR